MSHDQGKPPAGVSYHGAPSQRTAAHWVLAAANDRRCQWVFAFVLFLAALWGLYTFAVEPQNLRLEEVRISVADLPPAIEALRIIQISDLHIVRLAAREERAQEMVNAQQPDLIVVTGDLIESTTDPVQRLERVEAVISFLEGLEATYGVWAVRGNTDIARYADQNNAYRDRMARASLHLLVDNWERIDLPDDVLYILGAEYTSFPDDWFAPFIWSAGPDGPQAVAQNPTYNSYSHYTTRTAVGWQDYTLRGIMMRTDELSGVGVTVYSQFPEGWDRYYRLRAYHELPTFHLSPHGTAITQGNGDTGVTAIAGTRYAFALQVETRSEAVAIRARVWEAGTSEPDSWQVACLDSSSTRPKHGTVGLWAVGRGQQHFANLEVIDSEGRELWPDGQAPGERWRDFGSNDGRVELAHEGLPTDAFALTLVHAPDQVQEAPALGLPVVLAGHTHGGQVQLPFFGAVYRKNSLDRDYVAGLLEWEGTMLYTNRGLGVRSGFPGRFLAPPEITLIHLLDRDQATR